MFSALSYYELGRLMQEFFAHLLVNHVFSLHQAVDLYEAPQAIKVVIEPGQPIQMPARGLEPVSPELRAAFKPGLQRIREEIVKLRFKSSRDTIEIMLAGLDAPDYTIRGLADDATDLHGRLVSELKYTTCLALLEGEDEDLFLRPHLFGEPVSNRFQRAVGDIAEGGKCLAFDRGTACVFHLMRVLEIGLQELARDLKIPKIEENWEKLLNDVTGAINALPFKTEAEKAYRTKRSASVAHLRNVKDAWRNPVMHPAEKYTPEEAKAVWVHTKALMQSLA